jgi:hypothetical protein
LDISQASVDWVKKVKPDGLSSSKRSPDAGCRLDKVADRHPPYETVVAESTMVKAGFRDFARNDEES